MSSTASKAVHTHTHHYPQLAPACIQYRNFNTKHDSPVYVYHNHPEVDAPALKPHTHTHTQHRNFNSKHNYPVYVYYDQPEVDAPALDAAMHLSLIHI